MGIIGVFFLLIRLYFQILKTVWVFWDFFAKGFVIIQLGIFAEVRFFFPLHSFYFFVLCSIFLLFRVGFGFLLFFFLGFCCIKLCDWFGLGTSNIAP